MTKRGQNNLTRTARRWARHGGQVDLSNNETGYAAKYTGKSSGSKSKK
jgi:hypothetical protein